MAENHGLITYRQALEHLDPRGIAALVRRGDWVRVRRGVFTTAEAWAGADPFVEQPRLRVRAAHAVLQSEHWFSHDSSAVFHGIPLPDVRRSLVHVTRPLVTGDRTKAGIKHHKAPFALDQAEVIDGLPMLDRTRTALDVCREHGLVAGVAALDRVLALGTPCHALGAATDSMRSWPGTRTVRAAIELADPGAESYGESVTRVLVTELGFGRPETQFGLTDGHRTVWTDLRVLRHVIEFDGRVKYDPVERGGFAEDPRRALWEEKARQDFIAGFKLGISRVTYADLGNWEATKRRLDRQIRQTCAMFGTDLADLTPYLVRRHAPRIA